MNFYLFKVKFFDTVSEQDKNDNGITFGSNYINAMDKIVETYGSDNIISVELKCVGADAGCFLISDDTYEKCEADQELNYF